MRRKSAVSAMSHLQYEERMCEISGGLHLQYEDTVVQCKERVYGIRQQSVQFVETVCSIRNVTSAVREDEVCSAHLQ